MMKNLLSTMSIKFLFGLVVSLLSLVSMTRALQMCSLDGDSDGRWVSTGSVADTGSCSELGANRYLLSGLSGSTLDCDDADPIINPATYWYEDVDADGWGHVTVAGISYTGSNISWDTGISYRAGMWDINGDTYLDIYVATNSVNKIWINNGSGTFTANNNPFDTGDTRAWALWDVDGDGDLDLYAANYNQQNKLRINNGSGSFTANHIAGDLFSSLAATMWDVDGDNDLDIYVGNRQQQNKLWINDGAGNFTWADITGDTWATYGVVMWDVDGDGDLDLYAANNSQQNKLWINNGSGSFSWAHIIGDLGGSRATAMGDIDGDGDIDIHVANYNEQNYLWFNNGSGTFTSGNIVWDTGTSLSTSIWDVDDDNDLDIYVVNYGQQNKLRINDGSGNFVTQNIAWDTWNSQDGTLWDVNGDGYLDIYISKFNQQNRLWVAAEYFTWVVQQCADPGADRYLENELEDTVGDEDDNDPDVHPAGEEPEEPVESNGRASSITEDNIDDEDEDNNDNEDDEDEDSENDSDSDEDSDDDNNSNDENDEEDASEEITSVCTEDLVGRMHREGLTIYDDQGEFRGDEEITRGEAARFVSQFGKIIGLQNSYRICEFTDIAGFDGTLTPYIQQACNIWLLKGHKEEFIPKGKLTTAQSLAIIVRALYGFQDETTPYRYESYVNIAYSLGIETNLTLEELWTNNISRRDFGLHLCQAAQAAEALKNN